eukprot:scpid71978/ scgid16886/ 
MHKSIKYFVWEFGATDSMRCNYTKLFNRVRYWQFITSRENEWIVDRCEEAWDGIMEERDMFLAGKGTRPKNGEEWTEDAMKKTGVLSDDRLSQEQDRLQEVKDFIADWENVDAKFYTAKGTRAILSKALHAAQYKALKLYYYHDQIAVHAMKELHQDKGGW